MVEADSHFDFWNKIEASGLKDMELLRQELVLHGYPLELGTWIPRETVMEALSILGISGSVAGTLARDLLTKATGRGVGAETVGNFNFYILGEE